MNTNRVPAIALAGVMMASLILALPAPVGATDATACSDAGRNMSCDFLCVAGYGTSVGASSSGRVDAGSACPETGSHCDNHDHGDKGPCTGSGPVENTGGQGHCSGYASNGDGTATCQGGGADGSALLAGITGLTCESASSTFPSLGIVSIAVVRISMDPVIQAQSYTWTWHGGCTHVPSVCENVKENNMNRKAVRCDLSGAFNVKDSGM
jgi:hypothetical protein